MLQKKAIDLVNAKEEIVLLKSALTEKACLNTAKHVYDNSEASSQKHCAPTPTPEVLHSRDFISSP